MIKFFFHAATRSTLVGRHRTVVSGGMTLSVLLILTIIPPMLAVMLRGPFEEELPVPLAQEAD